MYIFGGETSETLSDLWEYSFDSEEWSLLEMTNNTRSHQGMVIDSNNILWIYGGQTSPFVVTEDLISLDLGNPDSMWHIEGNYSSDTFEHPDARSRMSMIEYDEDYLLVFGGELQSGSVSTEIWLFLKRNGTWERRSDIAGLYPNGVSRHKMVKNEDNEIFVFGGYESFSKTCYYNN